MTKDDRYERMRKRVDELSLRVAYLEGRLSVAVQPTPSRRELIKRTVKLEMTQNSRRKRA